MTTNGRVPFIAKGSFHAFLELLLPSDFIRVILAISFINLFLTFYQRFFRSIKTKQTPAKHNGQQRDFSRVTILLAFRRRSYPFSGQRLWIMQHKDLF